MPFENKNFLTEVSAPNVIARRSVLERVMAVNIETRTPMPSVRANPLTAEVPSQKRIKAVMMEEIFESRIESHARAKPS